jgi:hypothetical protein
MKRTLLALAAGSLLLTGCSSDTGNEPAPTTETTVRAEPQTATCPTAVPIDDPTVAAAVAAVPLPAGASLVGGRISTDSDEPGMFATAITLCDPSITTADGLRPIATEYAKALKASPSAEQIFAVYVETYQTDGRNVVNEVKLKDGDFQLHLWNGKPSASAELKTWEVIAG